MSTDLSFLGQLADDAAADVVAGGRIPDPDRPAPGRVGASMLGTLGADPATLDRVAEIDVYRQSRDYPATARVLADPARVAEAAPDVENMNMLERIFRESGARLRRGEASRQLGHLGAEALRADVDDPVREFEIERLRQRIGASRDFGVPDEGVLGFLANAPGATAETLPQFLESLAGGVQGGVTGAVGGAGVGAAMGAPAGPPGIAAGSVAGASTGFVTGSRLGAFITSANAEAGHAFLELREIQDDAGNRIDRNTARLLATGVGALNGAIELLGLRLLPGSRRLLAPFSREGARHVFAKPALRRLLAAVAGGGARGFATEGFTEAAQETLGVVSVLAGHVVQGGSLEDFTHTLADPETGQPIELRGSEAVWARVLEAMQGGAQAGLLLGAGGRVVELGADSQAAQRGAESAKRIVRLGQVAAQSTLRETNVEAFKAHVRESAQAGDGIDKVYVSADAMRDALDNADDVTLRDVLENVPGIREQRADVDQSGADFVLSMEDYLAHVATTPIGQAIADHMRLRPDEMTPAESQAFRQGLSAEFAQATEEDQQRRQLATALVHMREQRRPVADQMPKAPLLSLLRDLGGVDPDSPFGVELREMVPTHGRGSFPGLYRKGATLRTDSLVISEHPVLVSNFQESGEGYVSEQDLLGAIDEERRGRPLHTEDQQRALEEESLAFDTLQQAMEEAGLTLESATDREILARIFPPTPELDFVTGEPVEESTRVEDLIADERRYAEQTGAPVTPFSQAMAEADRIVRRTKVRHLEPHRYRVQAARDGREAFAAAARGDWSQAQILKRRQLFNTFAEQIGRRMAERARANTDYLARVQTPKRRTRLGKAGADYLEQVDALLARFDLNIGTSLRELDRRKALREWILEQEMEGESVIIPDRLRDEAFTTNWRELTADELDDLANSIKNVEQLARRKVELMDRREERDLESVRVDLAEAAERHFTAGPEVRDVNPSDWERVKRGILSAESSLRKVEFLVDELDGKKPDGPWRRYVFQPIADAEAERNDLNRAYTVRFAEMLDALVKGKRHEYATKHHHPQLDTGRFRANLSRSELIAIALNLGNDSNKQKLLEGRGWTERSVMNVLDQELSRADWDFVQATWNLIESLWPKIAEQQRSLVGVVPQKIQPREVVTRHGTFSGGYYPVVYDPEAARWAFKNADRGVYAGLEFHFARPITGHGHTIERAKVVGPILLDLGVIPSHLDQVIHDLTHREVVTRIDRLLEHPTIHASLERTAGVAAARMFRPWLQGIAQDRIVDNRALSGLSKALRMARVNVTSYTLGLRYTTLLAQTLGNFNTMALLRERVPNWRTHYATGLKKAWRGFNPKAMQRSFDHVAEQSGEMRNRIGQIDRDLRDSLRRNLGQSGVEARAKRAAMELIGKVQMYAVDLPAWYAAYEGGTVELNLSHEQAVEFADSIVRMSQGGAGAKDLSAIQRGDEGFKQLLLFFSWRNTFYNQLRQQVTSLKDVRDVPGFLAASVFRVWLPAIGAGLISGQLLEGEDDDELYAKLARLGLSEVAGSVPLVEASALLRAATGVGPRFRGAQSPVQRMVDQVADLVESDDPTEFMLNSARVVGVSRGLPLAQPIDFAEWAIGEGD